MVMDGSLLLNGIARERRATGMFLLFDCGLRDMRVQSKKHNIPAVDGHSELGLSV